MIIILKLLARVVIIINKMMEAISKGVAIIGYSAMVISCDDNSQLMPVNGIMQTPLCKKLFNSLISYSCVASAFNNTESWLS